MKTATTVVAFDPGERWTGVALAVIVGAKDWRVETCVLDGKDDLYRPAELLDQLQGEVIVVAEDFKAWPVRHQSWNPMLTARLLGALEHVSMQRGHDFNLQPAGNADRELAQLALGRAVMRWKKRWPSGQHWEHAMSAWRVFARYLMDVEPATLRAFMHVQEHELRDFPLGFHHDRQGEDLIAPPISWSWK